MALRLVIGNQNYSSWSMRPWIAMRTAGIDFETEVVPLDTAQFAARVGALSGNRKVPLLIDGQVLVWESLAILEYVAERFPHAGLWPADPAARAHARAVAAEMHAGFTPLRRNFPMNMRRPVKPRVLPVEVTADVAADIARIEAMWSDCRARFGRGGPFLFGAFGAADAMYAPVVARFHTYAIDVGSVCRAYMAAVMALPAWREWVLAAAHEVWVRPKDEVD